jgi:hypothetical protein
MGSIDHIHATPGSPDGSRVRADLDAMLAMTVREWLEDVWPWRPERIREHPMVPAS